MSTIIETKKLIKNYYNGDLVLNVLKSLDLLVKKGEFVTITGRSGSGKSTLLYQLGLLDKPTSGQIILEGVDASSLSENDMIDYRLNKLGYIFQDYAILPEMTAAENIMLPLLMQGLPEHLAYKKSLEALERVQLAHRPDNLPSQLSGGEQQRVSIARALAHNPTIMFADEPTANLDSETAEVIMNTFVNLNRDGQTIVMVTHEPEYTELGHRTVELDDGVIVGSEINKRVA